MGQNLPSVSIIIPSYNHEQYVSEAIQSALEQEYSNLEIIVIDDASTDRTFEIVKSLQSNRLVLVQKKENKGVAHSLNMAMNYAKGEFIKSLASDDILLPGAIKDLVKCAVKTGADVIAADAMLINSKGVELGKLKESVITPNKKYERHYRFISFQDRIVAPTTLIKRRAIVDVDGWNENFMFEDWKMWMVMARYSFSFAKLDKVVVKYRNSPNSLSSVVTGKEMIKMFFSELPFERKAIKRIRAIYGVGMVIAKNRIAGWLGYI